MKIALIISNNIFKAPYLRNYTSILEENKIDYSIISWNRNNVDEPQSISFNRTSNGSAILKFWEFFRFARFVKRCLLREEYDRVVIFSIQLSIFLSKILKGLKQDFILDIRDYSPVVPFIRKRLLWVVKSSHFTVLSSFGFVKWLPKSQKYVLNHNVTKDLIHKASELNLGNKLFFKSSRIQIVTIGQIRDLETNFHLIETLSDQDGFFLRFIGRGPASENLKNRVRKYEIRNVEFHGAYLKEEEGNLISGADFLNILVNRDDINGSTLLTNRLYLSAIYGIPCIVYKNTAQSTLVEKYNMGIVVDNLGNLKDLILEYRKSFDRDQFLNGCSAFLKSVRRDNQEFENRLLKFTSIK